MVFYNQVIILEQLRDPGKTLLEFTCHMIEINLDLKLGLDKEQEMPQKLFHLSSDSFSSILSMYLGQIDTDISLISLFIHCFSDKRNLLYELSDLIIKYLDTAGFDR